MFFACVPRLFFILTYVFPFHTHTHTNFSYRWTLNLSRVWKRALMIWVVSGRKHSIDWYDRERTGQIFSVIPTPSPPSNKKTRYGNKIVWPRRRRTGRSHFSGGYAAGNCGRGRSTQALPSPRACRTSKKIKSSSMRTPLSWLQPPLVAQFDHIWVVS